MSVVSAGVVGSSTLSLAVSSFQGPGKAQGAEVWSDLICILEQLTMIQRMAGRGERPFSAMKVCAPMDIAPFSLEQLWMSGLASLSIPGYFLQVVRAGAMPLQPCLGPALPHIPWHQILP